MAGESENPKSISSPTTTSKAIEGGDVVYDFYIRLGNCTMCPRDWKWEWFKFSSDEQQPQLSKFSEYQASTVLSSILAVDSHLYCLGGLLPIERTPSCAVSRYDTSSQLKEDGLVWEEAPPMGAPKVVPQVVFTGGKIFSVVGCHPYRPKNIEFWAECFDPYSNYGWKPVMCTFQDQLGCLFSFFNQEHTYFMSVVEPGVKILFTCRESTSFVYNLKDLSLIKVQDVTLDRQKCLGDFIFGWSLCLVPVGPYLYSVDFNSGSVLCYDSKTGLILVQDKVLGKDYEDTSVYGLYSILYPSHDNHSSALLHVIWVSFGYANSQSCDNHKLNYRAIEVPLEIKSSGTTNCFGYGELQGCQVTSSHDFYLSSTEYNNVGGLCIVRSVTSKNQQLEELQQNAGALDKCDVLDLSQEAISSTAGSDQLGNENMSRSDLSSTKKLERGS